MSKKVGASGGNRDIRLSCLGKASTWGDGETGWWEYEVGPHTLAITTEKGEWKASKHGASVALEVDDFDAAIAHLKAKSVEFVYEPFTSPVCRCAIIADPDGNRIRMLD